MELTGLENKHVGGLPTCLETNKMLGNAESWLCGARRDLTQTDMSSLRLSEWL